MEHGKTVRLKALYADLPAGTEGQVIKVWTDPYGNEWIKIFICRMQDGRKVTRAIPKNMLTTQ